MWGFCGFLGVQVDGSPECGVGADQRQLCEGVRLGGGVDPGLVRHRVCVRRGGVVFPGRILSSEGARSEFVKVSFLRAWC